MNWLPCALFFISLVNLGLGAKDERKSPIVKTPLGKIKGTYEFSANGRKYESYRGVPYALPPSGERRFEPPVKQTPWTGTLLANKFGSPCLQYNHLPELPPERVEGAEDCLYINIYKPVQSKKNAEKLPVIFWIHGGCFQYGTGNNMSPRFLMDRDVIFVTVNYRLGPFGFLSTEDEVVTGNMGLKDQSMAIKWVSENIASFNGDPKRIMITGLSAGGASVHYQYLSPLSANLFQNGISFSGTALLNWAQAENSLEKAKKFASILGCPTSNTRKMVDCLKERPGRALSQATAEFMPWLYNPYTPFGPVVEKKSPAPFIDRSPIEIISSGDVNDVPWITTVVSEEGLYPAAEFVLDEKLMKELNDGWLKIAPHLLDYNFTVPLKQQDKVSKMIRQHYLGSKPIDVSTKAELIQMVGDRLFVTDGAKTARLMAKHMKSPVWFYYFSYRGAHSLSEPMSHSDVNMGVSHADDSFYVVDTPFVSTDTTVEDRKMQKELLDLWLSFVNTKAPKVPIDWPTLKSESGQDFTLLHIKGPGDYKVENMPNLGERKFWESIDFNENKLKGTKDEL